MKDLYVIVLAYNHWLDTQECLDSLLQSRNESMQIVVVDNGSTDETNLRVRQDYPSVQLVALSPNVGLNRGYNAGLERAIDEGAKYIAVMNNDTSADATLFDELKSLLEKDAHVGMAVPKIVYYDDPRRIWSAGAKWRRFPPGSKTIGLNELDGPRFNQTKEIDLAISCCLLIRSETLVRVGLFDPGYVFYYGDWDFSYRVRRGGYKIMYVPQARLKHKVSITTRKDNQAEYAAISGKDSARFYSQYVNKRSLVAMTAWVMLRDIASGNSRNVLPYLKGVREGLRSDRLPPKQAA